MRLKKRTKNKQAKLIIHIDSGYLLGLDKLRAPVKMSRKRFSANLVMKFIHYLYQYGTPENFIRKYEEKIEENVWDENLKQHIRVRVLKEIGFKHV